MVELTTEENNVLAQMLLENSEVCHLHKGVDTAAVAAMWNVSRDTIYRIWNKAKLQRDAGLPIWIASKKFGCTRSTKITLDPEVFKAIPLNRRRTTRSTGAAVGIGKSTIARMKKTGKIKAHSNAIKPRLNDSHKIARLKYCLHALRLDSGLQKIFFKTRTNRIHMDEKWFDMSEPTQKFYMMEDETIPYRSCQSKAHIPKVMFNCAVCRPMYSCTSDLIFDGKIGIWPFTTLEPAQRSSKNRVRGTLETKAIPAVTKDVTRDMLINKVIPAIQQKWPSHLSKDIIIQWDNARPHITNEDPLFREAASSNGFNINLVFQPANSPDTNINDLGWFRSIQSLKAEVAPNTLDELISEVETSYKDLCHIKLNKVFLSLQGCMIEIMKDKGGNIYSIKHQQKDMLIRQGILPKNFEVDINLVKECLTYLNDQGESEGFQSLMTELGM